MRRLLLTSVSAAALMMTTTAMADTASIGTYVDGMGVLENEWIRAGINLNTGTFGSGGNTSPGLLFDPTGTGTFNPSYDYLTPGSPFDGFAVKVDDTNYTNNNQGIVSITKTGEGSGPNAIQWSGEVTDKFQIDMNYSLVAGQPFINGIASINMLTDAGTVSFGKFIDPDSQGMVGDSSSTDNVLGYGVIPSTNVAFSEATVSRYALGIYTTDTNVTAGINGWSTQADGYDGTDYTDADGNPVNYGNSDDTIGISWYWTGVTSGDILEASYAYIFGPSAFDAADDAVTGGAGGGDTTTTDSWGTVEDVGSATEAAESGASGGSTPVITYSDPVVDTDRPVLTASITHHTPSDDGSVQTINREKTTTVTTPMEIITYTDGVETASTDTTSDIVTTVTNPESFVGRIDQYNKMTAIGTSINRNMHVNPWQTGGAQAQWGKMWITGDYGKTSMDNGYDADTKGYGAQVEFQFMPEWRVSVGVAKSTTDLTGSDSASTMDKINVNIGSIFEMDKLIFATDIGAAKNDYTNARTISTYANASETSGRDIMAKQRVYYKLSDSIIPFVGAGITKTTRDGFTESGWVVSARTVEEVDEINKYAEGGMRLQHSFGDLNLYAQGSYTTDKIATGSVGAGYQIAENASINIGATISDQDEARHTSGRLSANIKF